MAQVFPVNFAKFVRTRIIQNTAGKWRIHEDSQKEECLFMHLNSLYQVAKAKR